MKSHFACIIIGGGSAGYSAARTAKTYTSDVAIIDNSHELGGLCILRGCMPSKTLIYSAEVLHLAQNPSLFGLKIPKAQVDIHALHQRKKKIIHEFAQYRQNQLQSGEFTLIRSSGAFINETTFQLSDRTQLTADKFIIATGSSVNTPNIPGLKDIPFLTSDDILDLKTLPESIIILGGGIVACELSQFLNRIGVQVIQIQRSPHILKENSTESASVLETVFRNEGIELYTDTQITNIQQIENNFITVQFQHNNQTITKKARYLLNALGRKANTHHLGLDKAKVYLKKSKQIETTPFLQTSNPNIYAAGDSTGPHEIVHVAILQGECAAHHAFNPNNATPINYNHLVRIVFTDPQIAYAGATEKELQNENIDFLSSQYPFDDHGKSILMEAKYGYVKLFVNKKNRQVIGAECVGKDASELIHSMAVAITLNATLHDLLKVHWYHPTLSEIWTYPIEEIIDKL